MFQVLNCSLHLELLTRSRIHGKVYVLEYHSETFKSWKLDAKSLTKIFSLVNYFCKLVSN